jgi:hypothetical protein
MDRVESHNSHVWLIVFTCHWDRILTCICLRWRSLLKVASRAVTLTSRASVTLTRMRSHYVVGGTVYISHCFVTLVPHLWSLRGVVHSYLTYSVLASRTTIVSDSTASAAFNRKNVESKRIPSIFSDESTASCICLRLDLYMSHVNKV